jgi:hypothetical protein
LRKWSFSQISMKTSKLTEKRIFWGLLGTAVILLIYFLAILPLVEAKRSVEEEIAVKRKTLIKYKEFLESRKAIEEGLDQILKQYEEIQKNLLPGETPQLGAAALQEIVKRLSEKNAISIRSFRILEPKEINSFRKVSVQIDFNPTNSILSLGQFIHDIEHHEKELMISEMDLAVLNIRMPTNLRGNMVISGLMQGTKTKEKGK